MLGRVINNGRVTRKKKMHSPLLDSTAVDLARRAVEEVGEGDVGKHRGVAGVGRNVATHRFEAHVPGYPGWEWHAVVACAEGSRTPTVNEVALVPGGQALQAPEWVPYSERLRPGDLGPGDLMPPAPDDDRLDGGKLSEAGLKEARSVGARSMGRIRRWRRRPNCSAKPVLFTSSCCPISASVPMNTRRMEKWCTPPTGAARIPARASVRRERSRRGPSMMRALSIKESGFRPARSSDAACGFCVLVPRWSTLSR